MEKPLNSEKERFAESRLIEFYAETLNKSASRISLFNVYVNCLFLRFLFLSSWRTSKTGHSKIDSFGNYLRVKTCFSIRRSTSQK